MTGTTNQEMVLDAAMSMGLSMTTTATLLVIAGAADRAMDDSGAPIQPDGDIEFEAICPSHWDKRIWRECIEDLRARGVSISDAPWRST